MEPFLREHCMDDEQWIEEKKKMKNYKKASETFCSTCGERASVTCHLRKDMYGEMVCDTCYEEADNWGHYGRAD